MVNSQLLFDVIKYNQFTPREVAMILTINEDDFKKKMKEGIFQSNEIEMMLHFLKFPCNPMKVFFDTYNYDNPKKIEWWDRYRKTDKGKDDLARLLHLP